ncbi:hypothetical protein V415_21755 [Escherichia coli LAU-EC10]|nr:hypothetical protein ECVR50_3242 [Escherichia coli VR50]ETE17829.1 hypothetical protein V415_21755 [Escherichia coli LAU-EC10]PRW37476.1 hypothetical protein CSC05_3461 [Escherichia coli]
MFTNDIYVKKRREWMQRVLMLNEKIKNLDAQVNIFYFIIMQGLWFWVWFATDCLHDYY